MLPVAADSRRQGFFFFLSFVFEPGESTVDAAAQGQRDLRTGKNDWLCRCVCHLANAEIRCSGRVCVCVYVCGMGVVWKVVCEEVESERERESVCQREAKRQARRDGNTLATVQRGFGCCVTTSI